MTLAAAALAAWLCVDPAGTVRGADDDQSVPEYHLKAVFLYNFGRFVEWPKQALGAKGKPFVIGVVEKDKLEDGLALISGKRVKGRPVKVLSCQSAEEMLKCHIVFLNSGDDLRVKRLLQSLQGSPVLTVGETEGFCRWGGVINFRVEGQNLCLDICPRAAARAGLRISAQLLDLARIVKLEAE
jgi:hypothetical protein